MTQSQKSPGLDSSAREPDLRELAYQIWSSLGVPKQVGQVRKILEHLPANDGLLAELSARAGAPIALSADYAAPDLPTLWRWHDEGGWLQRYAEESAAASRAEEVQVVAAVSKERAGLKMRRMTVWEGILTAAERAVFEIDEDGNAMIGIVRRIESTEDVARLERAAKIMDVAARNLTRETGEVVDKVMKPGGEDAKGPRTLVISTAGGLDTLVEQHGESAIDPRLERIVREDVVKEERQKFVEQAHSLGIEVHLREPTPEEIEAHEEMKRGDADEEQAWNQSH